MIWDENHFDKGYAQECQKRAQKRDVPQKRPSRALAPLCALIYPEIIFTYGGGQGRVAPTSLIAQGGPSGL